MARTTRGGRRLSDHDLQRLVTNAAIMAAGRPTRRNRRKLSQARVAESIRMTARIERLGLVS